MRSKHIVYLDILRILAIMGIICIHAGIGTFFTWCNAMFIMISGALWLSKETIDLKKLFTKNILRIIIAFIFWSVLYTFFHAVVLPHITGEHFTAKDILVMLISGRYHLWFCYLIVGIYIGLPFWKKIAESETLLKYFLAVTFVFSFLIPCIQNIPKLEWTVYMTQNIHLDWAEYVFYFMLGYFLHTHRPTKKQAAAIYVVGIVSFISIALGIGNNLDLLRNVAILCCIFVLFQNIEQIESMISDKEWFIGQLSSLCFGVYLAHDFFLTIFQLIATSVFHFNNNFEGNIGIQICQMLFALLASLGCTYLIRKLPRIGRFIT